MAALPSSFFSDLKFNRIFFYPRSKTLKTALPCTWRRTDTCRYTSILTVKYCQMTFSRCFALTLHISHCASKSAVKTDSEASKTSRVFLVRFGVFSSRHLYVVHALLYFPAAEFKLVDLQQFSHPFHPSRKRDSICPSPRTSPTLYSYRNKLLWLQDHLGL